MKYIVYLTTCLVNKKIYIGVHKTSNPDIFDGYIGCGVCIYSPSSYNRARTPFLNAVKKYGHNNFIRQTLRVFDNKTDAYDLERFLVDENFVKRRDTYNCVKGGEGSPDGKSIYQFNSCGELLKNWASVEEASFFYNVSNTAIRNAIHFKGSCASYYWSYNSTINIKEFLQIRKGTTCYMYDAETCAYLETFDSMTMASKVTGIAIESIRKSASGGFRAGKYYFSTKLLDEYQVIPKINLKKATLYIYDLPGNFITSKTGSTEICEFFKCRTTANVTACLRSGKPYHGYQLSLEYKEKLPEVIDKKNRKKKVGKYTETGDLVEIYDSINQAKIVNGPGCAKVLRGQQRLYKNFIFKYIQE